MKLRKVKAAKQSLLFILLFIACYCSNDNMMSSSSCIPQTLSDGITDLETYIYDSNNRLSQLITRSTGGDVDTFKYSYNAAGRISAITSKYGGNPVFTYNSLGQLSSINSGPTAALIWDTNQLTVTLSINNAVYRVEEFTFVNQNVTQQKITTYNSNGGTSSMSITTFSNFDSNLSPEYLLAMHTGESIISFRAGSQDGYPLSKNNALQVDVVLNYYDANSILTYSFTNTVNLNSNNVVSTVNAHMVEDGSDVGTFHHYYKYRNCK